MYKPNFNEKAACLIFAEKPIDTKAILKAKNNIFVCGGLQNPEKMKTILGKTPPFAPAAIAGYKRTTEEIDQKQIPFMAKSKDQTKILTGILWLDLKEEDIKKIEGFELAGNYRKRINLKVQVGDEKIDAITYVKK